MRFFNTEGQCNPSKHYMVNLEGRLNQIKKFVDDEKYFYIQRGRQYGKTTTLRLLEHYLKDIYIVISLDFQKLSDAQFRSEEVFCKAFAKLLVKKVTNKKKSMQGFHYNTFSKFVNSIDDIKDLGELFFYLSDLCDTAEKPIVLIVDEIDSAVNNQVFLDFLAQIRVYYLDREDTPTFQSIILAGVYDIKNLKLKFRLETEHRKFNSPWNIAARFNIDMNFSVEQISGMLAEYEKDYHTGMKIEEVARIIYNYTSGYPYLVSAICKLLDEEISNDKRFHGMYDIWNETGISEAVKILLKEDIPLFGSLIKQLDRFEHLRIMIRNVLFRGQELPYSLQVEAINLGVMFGYLKEKNNQLCIANRIFEMLLQNMFIMKSASNSEAYQAGLRDKNQFIQKGRLNMDYVMDKFVQFYEDIFSDKDEKYIENFERELFLMYLKPIINGVGNYYQESITRNMTHTDIVVDYLGEQFIIELKIWHGMEYNKRGEKQLCEYLDFYRKKKGYLLSFNFNKSKKVGIQTICIDDKVIIEAVV